MGRRSRIQDAPAEPDRLTLGRYLRGARFGYHPIRDMGLVRITPVPRGRWLLDLVAPREVSAMRRAPDDAAHVVWWDVDAPAATREAIERAVWLTLRAALGPVRLRRGRIRLIVDDAGRRIASG